MGGYNMSGRILRHLIAVSALLSAPLLASPANAGCGCDKAPPPPAEIRPAFASPGQQVTLFSDRLRAGRSYRVRFEGIGDNDTVYADAIRKRDLADGEMKTQLVVQVPWLFPGPTRIKVTRDGDTVLRIDDEQFTVLQKQLRLEEGDGVTIVKCYRAAVGSDGTVYFPVQVGAISQHMIFSGLAERYPLLFDASDVAIYNTQGFLMQLLTPDRAGVLYTIEDLGSPDSFELTYDRHEFVTYKEQHRHEGRLALDSSDPAWHVDGTPHVDHDNLVIAIAGRLENGELPRAGWTPAFDLSIATAIDAVTPATTRTIEWSGSCRN
jgi:hypothetical protein